MTVTLADCAEELYSADPAGFVARRAELVKQAKADKNRELATEIGKLRRPTVAAWYVNIAARNDLPALSSLFHVGARMRAAQARLDLAEVRDLGASRRQLEQQVLTELRTVLSSISVTPSPAAMDEVLATLTAAVADPQAEQAVASGCLARSLSYAGFGEVDLTDALAAVVDRPARVASEVAVAEADESPDPAHQEPDLGDAENSPPAESAADRAAQEKEAQEKALAAARERRRAKQLDALRSSLGKATLQQEKAQAEVDRLTAALEQAQAAVAAATDKVDALADEIIELEDGGHAVE